MWNVVMNYNTVNPLDRVNSGLEESISELEDIAIETI